MKGLVFTFLLTYGVAAASFVRPYVGLLVYVCFSIIKPDVIWSYSVPPGNYARTVFFGLFLGWLLHGTGSWQWRRARLSFGLLCLYVAWSAISTTQAVDSGLAWNNVWESVKVLAAVVIGLSLIDSMDKVRQLAWTIVLSLGFLAFEFNLSYYSGENRLLRVGFAGMDEKSVGIMMVIGAAVALFLAASSQKFFLKVFGAGAAVLMVHVPLFSFSRGGMLGLIATAAIVFVLIPKKPAHLAVATVVLALGVRLAGAEVREFFMTSFAEEEERDWSAQSRLELWGQAWETIAQRPILGIGPRQWQLWSVAQYEWKTGKEVHNTWLQTGAELGIPGVAALIGFFGVTSLRLWRLSRRFKAGSIEAMYARMVIASLAGFFVSSQFITVYGLEVPYFVALVGAGLLKITPDLAQPAASPVAVPRTRFHPRPVAVNGAVTSVPANQ